MLLTRVYCFPLLLSPPLQMFKRLFPPDLFAAFIDVGHYNAQLPAYAHLVTHLEGGTVYMGVGVGEGEGEGEQRAWRGERIRRGIRAPGLAPEGLGQSLTR